MKHYNAEKATVSSQGTSNLKRNLHKLGEALLHPVFVSGGVVTQDQVEAGFEVALVLEEVYWAVVLAEEIALFG